jgi:hypothetical protein
MKSKSIDLSALFFALILLLGGLIGCWAILTSLLETAKMTGGY